MFGAISLLLIIVTAAFSFPRNFNGQVSSLPQNPPEVLGETTAYPVRAMWVQENSVYCGHSPTPCNLANATDKAFLDKIINLFKQGNLNVMLLGSYYRETLDGSSVNSVYKYLVDQAHANGIQVQSWLAIGEIGAWDEFYKQSDGTYAWRRNSGDFFTAFPQYSLYSRKDFPANSICIKYQQLADGSDQCLQTGSSVEYDWLDFSNPAARTAVKNLFLNLISRYGVDGVHLDYIRYPTTVDYGGPYYKSMAPAIIDPSFVNSMVSEIYTAVKAVNPNLKVSAAVMGSLGAMDGHYQYWTDWLKGGYIDQIFTMSYFDNVSTFTSKVGAFKTDPRSSSYINKIFPGLGVYYVNGGSVPITVIEQQADYTLKPTQGNFQGLAIFDSNEVAQSAKNPLLTYLASNYFSNVTIPTNTPVPTSASTPAPEIGDIDGDGCVGIKDFSAWVQAFKSGLNAGSSDIDHNGKIDLLDFNLWYQAMQSGTHLCL